MTRFFLGFIAALVLAAAAGFGYFAFLAPVATAASPIPFEATLAKMALNRAVGKEMPKAVPIQASEDNFAAGAKLYRSDCAICHGLPGQLPGAIAKGEFPKPPALFSGKGVTDDAPGETYWKIANGIRLTGMPAFRQSLSEEQMWQLSLLLANADKLPDSVKNTLQAPLPQ